ncbi:hypothetical protein N7492_008353 [Penicillium capsulatum]|uniref:Uncharacterized protein n=1 Tax=Penicillium capsulatum TaxID=69766 RepID=A0A9W9HSW3_9EURO|nr:hypothetical protein N7492_008353 [Penicillium capsulatum]KAJ6105756.1 hypothetical protein N7512_009273 [Penicillium capsulatum]
MLTRALAWASLVFNPITSPDTAPIQPQERLLPGDQQRPWQDILTGIRDQTSLTIHDRDGVRKWSLDRDNITQILPDDVHDCINAGPEVAEVKYMNHGKSIAATFSDSVIVVNHTPDNPATDKQITFALCRGRNGFGDTHTVEPLPGNLLAVATTGQRSWDGIVIFDASPSLPLTGSPPVLQNITGFPTVHSMIWDEQAQMLWAAGTDAAADGSDPVPAYGTLMSYPWDAKEKRLRDEDRKIYKLDQAYDLEAEWGRGYPWWAGMHDLIPIPGQRKFLLTEDRGLHAFDIETGRFTEHYQDVADKYLGGFQFDPFHTRHGNNSHGQWEDLPQSDLKSLSIAPDGSFVYVQAMWTQYRDNTTNLVVNGHLHELDLGGGHEMYRSRWFGDLPGWPKP